jgi:hypothetical protein
MMIPKPALDKILPVEIIFYVKNSSHLRDRPAIMSERD